MWVAFLTSTNRVTATSVVRLVYLLKLDSLSPDVTWNFSKTQIWTCVELHTAIISGEYMYSRYLEYVDFTETDHRYDTLTSLSSLLTPNLSVGAWSGPQLCKPQGNNKRTVGVLSLSVQV